MQRTYTIRLEARRVRLAVAAALAAVVAFPAGVMAGDRFQDVPDTNIFHDDIGAIAQAGVTRGCNPPENTEYCPGDFVTREQMAAFMNRLGALGPGQAPVVNAAALEGFHAAELAPRAAFAASGDLDDTFGSVLSTSITAPAAGVLLANATVDMADETAFTAPVCSITVDGSGIDGSLMGIQLNGDQGVNESENCTTVAAANVEAGDHTVSLLIGFIPPTTVLGDGFLTVLWVPFDGTGATP